jgi:hypothetical protein
VVLQNKVSDHNYTSCTCNEGLKETMLALRCFHMVFEDGFQALCYDGVGISHTSTHMSIIVAGLQSFCFFGMKVLENAVDGGEQIGSSG